MSYDNVRCDIELTLCLLICKVCMYRSKAMSFMIVIILLQRGTVLLFVYIINDDLVLNLFSVLQTEPGSSCHLRFAVRLHNK